MAITAMRTAQAFLPRALELPPRTYAATSGAGRYFYHSDDLKSRTPFSHAQSAILSNALAHVPTHGFTSSALSAGVRDAGYPDVSINLLTRGPFDLVHYHLVQQRLSLPRLVGVVDDKLDEWMRVRAILVRRLYANGNVVSRWTEVCASPCSRLDFPRCFGTRLEIADSHTTRRPSVSNRVPRLWRSWRNPVMPLRL